MKNIDIVYFEAGSGHRTSAEALQYALNRQHPDWSCRIVDLVDILDFDPSQIGRVVSPLIEVFNRCMRRERYFGFKSLVWWSIFYSRNVSRWHPWIRHGISRFWQGAPPDAVISVTPLFNAVLFESARWANPQVHCLTIPVDFEEMTPGYWFEPTVSQTYLIGSESLMHQVQMAQVHESEIQRVQGMPVHPVFYKHRPGVLQKVVSELALDPELPIGVISFGCQGTVNVTNIAESIISAGLPVNLICLCGRNDKVLKKIQNLQTPYPCVGVGYRPEPPGDLLQAADFLIGKPGTMTLTESLITRTPFIALKSTGLSPIQRGNEAHLTRTGTGIVADSIEEIPKAVRLVLGNFAMLSAIDREFHRGIDEIVDVIGQLVDPGESLTTDRRAAA